MFKKVVSLMIFMCIIFSMMTACSNSSKYVNKGKDRVVSSSKADSLENETKNKDSEPQVAILKNLENNIKGVFEGTAKIESSLIGETKDGHIKLEVAQNNDIKVVINDPKSGKYIGFIYKDNSQNVYLISSSFKDSAVKIVDKSYLSCMKDHMINYIIDAAMYNNLLTISDDNSKMKISFNNSSLYDCICNVLDIINSKYEEVYKLTKSDKTFMEWAENIIGDEYDLSSGLSKNALMYLTAQIGFSYSQKLIADIENVISCTILFNNEEVNHEDTLSIDIDLEITDHETNDSVFYLIGNIVRTGDSSDKIDIPENILTEIPEEIAPDNDDESPLSNDSDLPLDSSENAEKDEKAPVETDSERDLALDSEPELHFDEKPE